MNKKQIIEFLKNNKSYLESEYGVLKLGLFGSYLKGTNKKNSDIDILVELKKTHKFRRFFGLKHYLEKNLNTSIDLGIESTVKPFIWKSIKDEILYF